MHIKNFLLGLTAMLLLIPTASFGQHRDNRLARYHHQVQKTMQTQRNAARYVALPRQMEAHQSELLTLPSSFTPSFAPNQMRVQAADGTVLFGNMIYKSGWTGTSQISFYTFPVVNGNAVFTNVTGGAAFRANGGGIFSADKSVYHLIEYVQNSTTGTLSALYGELNTSDWTVTKTQDLDESQFNLIAYDLTRDPQSDKVYGIFINSARTGFELGIIDYKTLTRTTVGKLNRTYIALAANRDGQLFAIATDGNLYRLSKTDASATLVGSLGITVGEYQQSATFSQKNGTLYFSRFTNGASGLYSVDTTTGAATQIATFAGNEQLIDLEVQKNGYDAGAPAVPENMKVDFDKAARTADVSFTIPSKTTDGETLDGEVNYTIVASEGQTITGRDSVGETVKKHLQFTGNGKVNIYAYLSNDKGNGPETETYSAWLGSDQPKPASDVKLAVNGTTATVTWTAPTEGVNGGYVDPSTINYTLTRYPDNVTTTVKGQTSFSETLNPSHTSFYYYTVSPEFDGVKGDAAQSNKVRVDGPAFQVPFADAFETEDDFGLFDVSDLNGDGTTWEWNNMTQCASIRWGNNGNNDLLVSPAIHLEPGNYYEISYDVKGLNSQYTEKYKSAWGDASADASTYTDMIEDVTEVSNYQYRHVTKTVSVDNARDIRLAFWALSDANQGFLYIDNVNVKLLSSFDAPAAPRFNKAQAAAQGALRTDFVATAPDKTANGEKLTSLQKVVLFRDGAAIDSVTDVQPGGSMELHDETPVNGYNTYSLYAYNESGRSVSADTTLFVGVDVPQAPTAFRATDTESGIVLTWEAPGETGARGGYVDTSKLTYNIASSESSSNLAQDVNGLTWTDKSDNTGTQHMRYYGIQAKNEQGTGNWGMSNYLLVGDAYTLPFNESFPGQTPSHDVWIINDQNAFVESELSQDNDKGAMVMQSATDSVIILQSGKIDISKAQNPVLSFWYFKHPSDSKLNVSVAKNGGDGEVVKTISFDGVTQEEGWEKVILPLNDYKDSRYIQLGFTVVNDKKTLTAIDNITVEDRYAQSVGLTNIGGSTECVAGDSLETWVEVSNKGYENARNIRIDLSVNGTPAASDTIEELGAGVVVTKNFKLKATAANAPTAKIRAEVFSDGDSEQDDNVLTSDVNVKTLTLPTVDDLAGEIVNRSDNTVKLTWSRPDYHPAPIVTDSMEAYTAWTMDYIGDWTTFNANDEWGTATLPEGSFDHMGEEFTAIVYRPADVSSVTAHSGDQCLAVFDNDAWAGDYGSGCEVTNKYLISPELSGDAQTVDFWYANAVEYAPESFSVMYSTTGTEPENFQDVEGGSVFDTGYDTNWHEMSVDLPAGTKYFAFHVTSQYSYALLLDDVTFSPKETTSKLPAQNELLGYNIYRDSVQINNSLVTDTTATLQLDALTGNFQVSTVYTKGEACLSNIFDLAATGISVVPTAVTGVRGLRGMIVVSGADGKHVDISTIGGALVFSGRSNGDLLLRVQPGVYVVRLDDNGVKVVVK